MAASSAIALQKSTEKVVNVKPIRKVSLETYLKREEKSLHKHEFINGIIVPMPGAKAIHNQIAMQLGAALVHGVEDFIPPYIVYNSDMKIYIPFHNSAVYPDAVVVCEAPEYWNEREDLILNPILIVEVLSGSTQDYDRNGKFMKYKTLDSFREYVLVRQDTYHVETLFREEPGLWRETIQSDLNGKITFASLGISIDLKKIYKNITF